MEKFDINALRKEVTREYLNKGVLKEDLENALLKDSRYPKDRIIEITGYDLKNNKIFGLLGGKKCEVSVINNTYENMETSIPIKSQAILQDCIIEKNDSVISIIANRILKIAPVNDKLFSARFPVENNSIVKVQHLDPITRQVTFSQTVEKLRSNSSANKTDPKNK